MTEKNTTKPGKSSRDGMITSFLQDLEALNENSKGDFAALKRAAGSTIGNSRGAMAAFYKVLHPALFDSIQEEIYFLVATLYGHNDLPFKGNLGATMREIKERFDSKSLDGRMAALLDSDFELIDGRKLGGGELSYKLRQVVKLARSKDVGIDWQRLLKDLQYWTHPDKFVQKQWARAYYKPRKGTGNEEKK